jgi:hypothetical protein
MKVFSIEAFLAIGFMGERPDLSADGTPTIQ